MPRAGMEHDLPPQQGGPVTARPRTGVEGAFAVQLAMPLRATPVERGGANVPPLVTKRAGNDLVEASDLPPAEQPQARRLGARR
jgi:hypothetical protein